MSWSSLVDSTLKKIYHFVGKKNLDQCVLPVKTYGCETWNLNARMTQKLQITQRGMKRCTLLHSLCVCVKKRDIF